MANSTSRSSFSGHRSNSPAPRCQSPQFSLTVAAPAQSVRSPSTTMGVVTRGALILRGSVLELMGLGPPSSGNASHAPGIALVAAEDDDETTLLDGGLELDGTNDDDGAALD